MFYLCQISHENPFNPPSLLRSSLRSWPPFFVAPRGFQGGRSDAPARWISFGGVAEAASNAGRLDSGENPEIITMVNGFLI